MATKGTPRDIAQSTEEADIAAGTGALADLTRQQMATSASTASALLRALDAFQQTQLHMTQRAALLQEQTADRLRNANSPIELLAIQSTFALSSMSEWAQYTQELMLSSLKAQSEFMRPAEQQKQSASQAAGAAAPLFQAWQSVFTAPLNGAMAASARHH